MSINFLSQDISGECNFFYTNARKNKRLGAQSFTSLKVDLNEDINMHLVGALAPLRFW